MSQPRITLQQPKHARPLWLFALLSPLCVASALLAYTAGARPAVPFFFAAILAFIAFALFAELLNRRRVVIVELEGNTVTVTAAGAVRRRVWQCELSQVAGIASYTTPERFPRSRAELLCTNGREGVLLVQGIPDGRNEHPAVLEARAVVAEALGIKNLGFLGSRPRAVQLRANAA